jgi:hypothetical protein
VLFFKKSSQKLLEGLNKLSLEETMELLEFLKEFKFIQCWRDRFAGFESEVFECKFDIRLLQKVLGFTKLHKIKSLYASTAQLMSPAALQWD